MQLPHLTLTGLIAAVYGFVIFSAVGSATVTQRAVAYMYVSASIITILLLYVERSIAKAILGKTISSYRLSCDTLGTECTISAAYAGAAPGQQVWALPSASGQVLGMAAAFWTSYIAHRPTATCGGDECLGYMQYVRIAVLWAMVAAVVVYAVAHQFVTPGQTAIGLGIGTALGSWFYRLTPQKEAADP